MKQIRSTMMTPHERFHQPISYHDRCKPALRTIRHIVEDIEASGAELYLDGSRLEVRSKWLIPRPVREEIDERYEEIRLYTWQYVWAKDQLEVEHAVHFVTQGRRVVVSCPHDLTELRMQADARGLWWQLQELESWHVIEEGGRT